MMIVPKDQIGEEMTKYAGWVHQDVTEYLEQHLQKKLDKLITEEEKDSPLSWFQCKYNRAKRLGQREAIRAILKDGWKKGCKETK